MSTKTTSRFDPDKMDPVIWAEDVTGAEWRASHLEYLYRQFKVPWHDQDVASEAVDDAFDHPLTEYCNDIQRQTLRQIGLQTQLQIGRVGEPEGTLHAQCRERQPQDRRPEVQLNDGGLA